MNNQYTVGQEVEICHNMSFVGRAPSVIRKSVVTRLTKTRFFVKGLAWSDGSGKFNPDEAYWIATGKGVGCSGEIICRPVVKSVPFSSVSCVRKDELLEILEVVGASCYTVADLEILKVDFDEFGHPTLLQGLIDYLGSVGATLVHMDK